MQISKTQWIIIGVVVIALMATSACTAAIVKNSMSKDTEPETKEVYVYIGELSTEELLTLYDKASGLRQEDRKSVRVVVDTGDVYGLFEKNPPNEGGGIRGYKINPGTGQVLDDTPLKFRLYMGGIQMGSHPIVVMTYTEHRL